MSEPATPAKPAPRSSLARKLLLTTIVLVVLLAVLFFVATSSTFLKAVALPRVGAVLGARITADDVALSPFSQLVLTRPKVQTMGPEPLFAAQEVRVRYHLADLLRGNLDVPEITVTAPTVQLVQNADGTSNLDPILAALKAQKKTRPPKPPKPEKPFRLDIRNVALNQVTVRWVQNQKGGGHQSAELANFQIAVDAVKNGQAGKLTLGADARFEQSGATNGIPSNAIAAKLAGTYAFALGPELMPESVHGALQFTVGQAAGAFAELTALAGDLECDLTPAEIRQLSLQFTRNGQKLGQIQVSGPVDLAKTEAHLKLAVLAIDRHVLNLVGAARGWDFGPSLLNATSQVDLAQNASAISARGRVTGQRLSLKQHGQSTPALDLDLDYQFTANRTGKTALIQKFALLGKQNGTELLQATLNRPMQLSWGESLGQWVESAWELKLAGLDLNDWRPVLGNHLPTGKVALGLKLLAQDAGRRLKTELTAQLADVTAAVGTNQVALAEIRAEATGQVEDFRKIAVSQFQVEIKQPGGALASASGSANFDLGSHNLGAQANIEASAPGVSRLFPVPGVGVSSGELKVAAQFTQRGPELDAAGTLRVANFTGGYGDYRFQNFQPSAEFELALKGNHAQLKRVAITLQQGSTPAGRVDLRGSYDLGRKSGESDFELTDLNQNLLGPLLGPRLAPNQLVSVSLSARGSARYDPQRNSTVKLQSMTTDRPNASVQVQIGLTNLVVVDPEHRLPQTPWGTQFRLEGALFRQTFVLHQLRVALAPTVRANNELQAEGIIDFSKPGATSGKMSVLADSLDLTPIYDLLVRPVTTNAAAGTIAAAPAAPPAGQPTSEPPAVRLPIRQFGVDLNIGRLCLRDVAITHWTATTAIDGGQVNLKPFQLTLNGAPVNASATLNLGVPGYTYDVSLQADKVPLEPLANTFSPTYAGQAKGDLFAHLQIKGAGVTGASLRQNLTGQASLSLTNADIQLVSPRMSVLLRPVASLLRVSEITQSPLNSANAQLGACNGEINVAHIGIESAAFHAYAQGSITLADVLTNSPINHLPVDFYLSRGIASRAHLLALGGHPNAAFVKLPNFLKIGGTVGAPRAETDDVVITALIAGSAAGFVGGKAGTILQGVGGILSGGRELFGKPQTSPAPDTNAPPKLINPLNILNNLLGK